MRAMRPRVFLLCACLALSGPWSRSVCAVPGGSAAQMPAPQLRVAANREYPPMGFHAPARGALSDFDIALDEPFSVPYQGVALPKGVTALREPVCAQLTAMLADGSYRAPAAPWHLQRGAAPRIGIDGADAR